MYELFRNELEWNSTRGTFIFFFFYECNTINKYVYLKKREGGGGERKKVQITLAK